MRRSRFLALLLLLLAVPTLANAADPRFELRPRDHISLIGNILADRMQHDGWLEARLQARYPKHELVIRNLGFSGDELTVRLRSADFGSPDDWLAKNETDVVFAFFGANESFAGREGLDKFKKDLAAFLQHTLAQKYNGESPPRVVLFSPIAHEDLRSPDLPDGRANNERFALYTDAMAEVAKAASVAYVDLFHPTAKLYAEAKAPLTINGIHLNEMGNKRLAAVIDDALFPAPLETGEAELEKVRRAVLDKNFTWFNRYRTVDGYSIFGGRADLRFTDGQTNRVVMQREMEVLDVMTANRDRRIWAVAQGGDMKVDDSNTPPFIPVKTNKPGAGPEGAHLFLGGEEAIGHMTVAKGLKVNLFASEENFPELANPVQMAFDGRGRLWVAVWPTYPHWKPKEEMDDKLLILEDTDGDGKADRRTVFADGLHCPTGFEIVAGGVLIAQAPDLMLLEDTDGDDKADRRTRVLSGLDSADTHHTANSFQLDPGGALYFQEGTFHHTQVETPYGPPVRNANAAVYRYEPKTQRFEVYVPFGFANPHGHAFDRWGQDVVVDGTGANPYHGTLFSGHLDFPNKHPQPPQVYAQRTRPCPGIEFLSSRHFPEASQGNLLVANVIGFQGILQYKIRDDETSLAGTEVEPILSSDDPNFRPTDLKIGPDGALYFIDWQNPIIGHMQHNLRDPSRDRTHGRVYRVTCEGRPLLTPKKVAGQPIAALLDLLREPEARVRYRAKIELAGRKPADVLAALGKWVQGLDKEDENYEHARTEALWLHQHLNAVDLDLLADRLRSPDFRARAAAVRVLCNWRDRVPDALDRLKKLAADPYGRVRLEAVRAASFFEEPEALEVALISAEQPTDPYLDYVRKETMKALEPHWKRALAAGRPVRFTSDAGARYFLRSVTTADLLKMPLDRAVDREILFRPGVRDEPRALALADLARREKKDELRVVIDAIIGRDDAKNDGDEGVLFDLARLLTARPAAELAGAREEFRKLATEGHQPVVRQLGFVGLVAAEGPDAAWALATKSVGGLRDFLNAVPMIRDPGVRAGLYPKVEPLLRGLPAGLLKSPARAKSTNGRFVRIELSGRKTLTLAEVEVLSDGRNVARQGRASQKNTAHGGEAKRAIDGNKDSSYGAGGQTHTEENTPDPWWELDLADELPIDAVLIYNREEGFSDRLKGFTLKVLDNSRAIVFEKTNQPAPKPMARIEVGGGGPEGLVRRAAMNALTTMRGQEPATAKAIIGFIRSGEDRGAAIAALRRIPPADWPKEEAGPLVDGLMAYVRNIPVADRTSPAALDALGLADAAAGLLPPDRARDARRALGELGVRVLRIGTVIDQMLFDKERLVARAGRPVEILFENPDLMPHNFVITRPGSLEEVGLLAEATATQPDATARQYVPRSDKILFASRLLPPRESQRIRFDAPKQPGIYPFVCTYPGHWRRMYGAFVVVDDLDAYTADPDGYLAAHPLPIADELLKFSRNRTEWSLDELAPWVAKLGEGRSFANGRQMFQVANCVACHRLDGVGQEFGPDLAKLDPPQPPADLLKNILDPSAKLNEKYQAEVFETRAGKVLTGLVVKETPDRVEIVENPLVGAATTSIPKAEIAERAKSPNSLMPKGLLDRLTREEVLDLIAYIAAGGHKDHALFRGGEGHHHEGH